MSDILHRWWMIINDGAKPIDWLILTTDVLVLLAILWFEGAERYHKHKIRRRVDLLLPFIERGQCLQQVVPDPQSSDCKDWIKSTAAWGQETKTFLEKHSRRAARSFENTAETGILANPQIVRTESGRSFPIENTQRDSYLKLVAQLNNLRRITEQPDAYF